MTINYTSPRQVCYQDQTYPLTIQRYQTQTDPRAKTRQTPPVRPQRRQTSTLYLNDKPDVEPRRQSNAKPNPEDVPQYQVNSQRVDSINACLK